MKGILFKPWKIQFIAEHPDMEIQTRRVIKHRSVPNTDIVSFQEFVNVIECSDHWTPPAGYYALLKCNANQDFHTTYFRVPYQVGEVVYIKEAWCPLIPPVYNLIDPVIPTVYKQEMDAGGAILPKEFKWHSPMMMPESAARYFIKIVAVRAGRLQQITVEGILAEGCRYPITEEGHLVLRLTGNYPPCNYIPKENFKDGKYIGNREDWLKAHFISLWNSINKDYPFESNPWVFPYTFRLEVKHE